MSNILSKKIIEEILFKTNFLPVKCPLKEDYQRNFEFCFVKHSFKVNYRTTLIKNEFSCVTCPFKENIRQILIKDNFLQVSNVQETLFLCVTCPFKENCRRNFD